MLKKTDLSPAQTAARFEKGLEDFFKSEMTDCNLRFDEEGRVVYDSSLDGFLRRFTDEGETEVFVVWDDGLTDRGGEFCDWAMSNAIPGQCLSSLDGVARCVTWLALDPELESKAGAVSLMVSTMQGVL
jgi:hypothetical protein